MQLPMLQATFHMLLEAIQVLSNRCRSSGKLSKLWVVSWRFAFELIEGSVVLVSIGIPIGISYLLSIEEGLRDGKALKLVLFSREDTISIINMRCKAYFRVDIQSRIYCNLRNSFL